jgi:O-antigen ligase
MFSSTRHTKSRGRRNWPISAALALALLCSAVSAGFEGDRLSTVLQLMGILIPFGLGVGILSRHFLAAPVWRSSPESGLLMILFLTSATISALLAALANYDLYPVLFHAGTISAFIVYGGIWAFEEELVWNSFRIYCLVSTVAIVAIWIVERHPGERFGAILHPNLWGLLCFANFCLSGLIGKMAVRLPVQLGNVLVILDAQSRSALLSVLIAAAIMCLFSMRSSRMRKEDQILALVAAVCACAIFVAVFWEHETRFFNEAFRIDDPYRGSGSGFSGRSDLWQSGLRTFEANPLFGVGPRMEGNYMSGPIPYSHSGYISTLAQYGAIGASLFFAMACVRARGLWLMARRSRRGAFVGSSLVTGYAVSAVFEPKLLSIGNPASLLLLAFLFLPVGQRKRTAGAPFAQRYRCGVAMTGMVWKTPEAVPGLQFDPWPFTERGEIKR